MNATCLAHLIHFDVTSLHTHARNNTNHKTPQYLIIYSNVSTVKHKSCFLLHVTMLLQEQHVSNQIRGHHQTSIVMKLKMAVHKQLAFDGTNVIEFIAHIQRDCHP
jgi:hypothetical protein